MASLPDTAARPAPGNREFVMLIAMLQALQALAIDAMLPALGVIAQELGAPGSNDRQLIIGVFLIGAGLGSLIPGTLADRYGRRPVLFVCLGAYWRVGGGQPTPRRRVREADVLARVRVAA